MMKTWKNKADSRRSTWHRTNQMYVEAKFASLALCYRFRFYLFCTFIFGIAVKIAVYLRTFLKLFCDTEYITKNVHIC